MPFVPFQQLLSSCTGILLIELLSVIPLWFSGDDFGLELFVPFFSSAVVAVIGVVAVYCCYFIHSFGASFVFDNGIAFI
jgi:hypothetical protein